MQELECRHIPTEDFDTNNLVCLNCGLVFEQLREFVQAPDSGYVESITAKDQVAIDPFAHEGVSQFIGRKPHFSKGNRRSITARQVIESIGGAQVERQVASRDKAAQKSKSQCVNMLNRAIAQAQMPRNLAMMVRSMFWAYKQTANADVLKRHLVKDPLILANLCCVIVAEDTSYESDAMNSLTKELGWKHGRSSLPKGLYGKISGIRHTVRALKPRPIDSEGSIKPIFERLEHLSHKLFSSTDRASAVCSFSTTFLKGSDLSYTCPSKEQISALLESKSPTVLLELAKWITVLGSWFNLVEGRAVFSYAAAVCVWTLRALNIVKFDPLKKHQYTTKQACSLIIEGEDCGIDALGRRLGELYLVLGKLAKVLGVDVAGMCFVSYGGNWLAETVQQALLLKPEQLYEMLWRSHVPSDAVSVRAPPSKLHSDQFSELVKRFCWDRADEVALPGPVKDAISELLKSNVSPLEISQWSAETILNRASRLCSIGESIDDCINSSKEVLFKQQMLERLE